MRKQSVVYQKFLKLKKIMLYFCILHRYSMFYVFIFLRITGQKTHVSMKCMLYFSLYVHYDTDIFVHFRFSQKISAAVSLAS